MDHSHIIEKLRDNQLVFEHLFSNKTKKEYLWKPGPEKWCLLEILCHLIDEEKEDFRYRTASVLADPQKPLPMINPLGWVAERKYMQQDFITHLRLYSEERAKSVEWLSSLQKPPWDNAYLHPKLGALTAEFFLTNWLAHDYLHIRQIEKVAYLFLRKSTGIDVSYAGNL